MLLSTRLTLVSFSLIAGAACLFAGETIAGTNGLVIGLLLPPEEPAAASLSNGATLSVEQANQFPGPRVSLVIRGRTGQWGADGVEAARMVTDDGARGLIAPPDGAASHLVLQVSGRTAVPVVSLCADSSVTETGVPWMVRIVPRTIEEAKTLFTRIPARRWTAVVRDGRSGREAARDLGEAATHSGCTLDKIIDLNPSLTNPARLDKRILATHPDAVLLWVDPATAGKLARALRSAGFTGDLAGPGWLRAADFSSSAGDAMEGLRVSGPILERDATTAFQHFADAFRDRFGREPDPMAAAAYDAATLLIHILRQPGDRPAHEAFPITFSLVGASGNLAFDTQGNRKLNLQLFQAHGGQFIPAAIGVNP
ncbi:MAG: ABC transporter substrate-binding protein [Verrucomicrobiota bacterium]|jgi:ABC-type branched-subunit amino acid transport system substrate-binding protein